jgi:multimeric flavodoxin WrbA
MTLLVTAIHGSARPSGNSRTLMDIALDAAREARPDMEVHVVRAYQARVDPCIGCDRCNEGEVGCSQTGDAWHAVETALRETDVLLIASPVYFMGLPAPVKAMVDRLQALWWYRERGGQVATNRGPFRRAGLILVAAGDGEVFDPSRRVAKAAVNTLGFELTGVVMAGGLEGPTDASSREELIAAARDLGRRLVE